MAAISTWSTTAASNNSASPDGWPENMAPSGVNNSARENMAALRTYYETMEWRDWGHTITQASGTTFTTGASIDTTGVYLADRRIKATGSSTGTIYGLISSSTGTNPTTVTVVWDSGSLVSESLTVWVGADPTGDWLDAAGVARSAVSTMTSTGDTIYRNSSGEIARLEMGTGGSVMKSDGTHPVWAGVVTDTTEVTLATGTPASVSFPASGTVGSYASTVELTISGASLDGTDDLWFRIGDAGGIATTGYACIYSNGDNSTTDTATDRHHASNLGNASRATSGTITCRHMGSDKWLIESRMIRDTNINYFVSVTEKTLGNTLTSVQILSSTGDLSTLGPQCCATGDSVRLASTRSLLTSKGFCVHHRQPITSNPSSSAQSSADGHRLVECRA